MCKTAWIDWSECTLVESVRDKMGGVPVLKGSEMPVQSLVDDIDEGITVEAVANEYGLNPADVKAVYEYCEMARAVGKVLPRVHSEPRVVTGPIWGIPGNEVVAWIASWNSNTPLPSPKARWIQII
ncbi:MAG: DUF433 domain-containing protein [Rhodopila sp.]